MPLFGGEGEFSEHIFTLLTSGDDFRSEAAYNSGILITTGQVQKISPDEIEFNVSQPDWVYDRAPLSGDNPASSHKDFVLSGSK